MNLGTLYVTLGLDMTQLDGATKTLNTTAQRFRTFGYLATAALTAPMVAFGKSAFTAARDYEFAIQKIVGLTGVAQGVVNDWSKEVLKMGPELARNPKELAEALYFISSSGIKGAEAMDVLKLSAKAATSGLGETQQIANLLTSALNAYAGTGLTASYATDVLVAAVREGKAEASSFSTAMGQVIPIAAQLGVNFNEVAGGMAAITLTGSSASSAAVYLKGVFNSLLTASTQGEKALNSVGTSYGELRRILGQEGLIPLMQKLRDIQIKYGDEIVSDVLPNIRALTGFLSLAGKNFKYNTELMQRVTESTGSLGKAFAAVADTIKVRYDQAIARAQTSIILLGKSIAEAILPILENWSKKLQNMVEHFNSLTDAQKRHRIELVAWAAAAGPLSLAISLIMYSISGLIQAGKVLIGVLGKMRVAMLSNPYILVGAGVAALGVGIVKLIRSTNDAKEAQNGFNNALVEVEGTMKRLKELTKEDLTSMNFMSLGAVKQEAIQQKETAFNNIKDAVARAGKTMDEFYAGERMGKYQKYIDSQVDAWNAAKGMINQVDGALDALGQSFIDNSKKGNETIDSTITNYQKLQKEIQAAHRLILDQYDAELRLGTDKIDSTNLIKELTSKQPIDYRNFFMKTGFNRPYEKADPQTILESQLAKGLVTEREYLDEKYKIDMMAAQQNADMRLAIETQYFKDLRAIRYNDINTYLEAASTAISSISALIEASKQRELSAVGDSARQREQIERRYFQKQKAWAIAQAVINGALAVTNLLAHTPGSALNPATWVGIGMAAASTAAQVAIISGQKMKEGGEVPAGFPNDTYPALLTSGERVIPKPKALNLERANTEWWKDVEFHVKGDELVGTFVKHGRKVKSYS